MEISFKETPELDQNLHWNNSSNVLCNYMREPEYLIKILKNQAIIPRYVVEPLDYLKVDYNVTPTKAESVSDAVASIHIFCGLRNGTIKINGKLMSEPEVDVENEDIEQWNDSIKFWETAQKLEQELDVKFNPSAEFTEGPLNVLLLGAKFDIYCYTKMSNFVITNIQWDDEKRSS